MHLSMPSKHFRPHISACIFSILSDLKKTTAVVESLSTIQPDVLFQRLPAYFNNIFLSVWQVSIWKTTIWTSPSRRYISEENLQIIQEHTKCLWYCWWCVLTAGFDEQVRIMMKCWRSHYRYAGRQTWNVINVYLGVWPSHSLMRYYDGTMWVQMQAKSMC